MENSADPDVMGDENSSYLVFRMENKGVIRNHDASIAVAEEVGQIRWG